MPADFRFIANAAQAHAREFAAERIGNRLAQAGFADAGRPDKTQDRPVSFGI